MKKLLPTFLSVFFCVLNSWAQPSLDFNATASSIIKAGKGKVKWIAGPETMPGNIKAFQENRGQFVNFTNNNWKILYGADYEGGQILFTDHGVIYTLPEYVKDSVDDDQDIDKPKNGQEEEEEKNKKKRILHNVSIEWENASVNLTVEAQDQTPFYFGSYAVKDNNPIKGYAKLVYHNVYPGIDIEYTFHKDKGIEYALKVKSGADPSVVKMLYAGEEKGISLDADGNVHIATQLGDIIDHAPHSSQNGNTVESAFKKISDNEIAFQVGNRDRSSELVIDPWTVSPLATHFLPSDVEMDGANNVYILGASNTDMYEQKYTAAGALSWTYNYSTSYTYYSYTSATTVSSLAVDVAGNSYVPMPYDNYNPSGGEWGMISLSTAMALRFNNNNNTAVSGFTTPPTLPSNPSIFEVWNVAYSCDYSEIVEGGSPEIEEEDVAVVNTTTGSLGTETMDGNDGEIYTGCIAPNGNYYCLSANPCFTSSGGCAPDKDHIVCYTLSAGLATYAWEANTTYTWNDFDYKNYNGIATNGIAASCSYLYTTNGLTLNQCSLTTGASVNSISIPNAVLGTLTNGEEGGLTTGGLAVDVGCGNVYVGTTGDVEIYSPTLTNITAQAAPSDVLGVCYNNNLIGACGGTTTTNGFVMVFDAQPCNVLTITHTNDICNPPTATATATATFCTGGTYNYLWTPGGQTTQTATGLSAGSYTVAVGTSTGCLTITDTVTITQPPLPSVTMGTIVDPSCSVTGSATCVPSGGVSPYTYAWSGGGGTNVTGTGFGAGTYTVIVTDANGCTATATATLTGTSTTASIAPPVQPLCFGDATTATASATGGTAPYTYAWSTTPAQTTATATGLTVGVYTVGVSSASGCTASATVTITQPPQLSVTTTANPAACGVSDGSATATATGGTAPYTYLWSNAAATANDANISAGSYTVTVTDNNHCTATAVAVVTSTGGTTASITASTNVSCFGGDNGNATVAGAGGVTPYTYAWNNTQAAATATGLSAGTYSVLVSDNQGCSATAGVTITQPAELGATTSFTAASCNLFNGSATVTVTGGTPAYAYLWNPSSQTTPTAAGISAGTYCVLVTDANGCTVTTCVTVTQPSAVTAYIVSSTGVSCFGGDNGTITAGASGGVAPYGYDWTPVGGSAATGTGFSAGTTYTVTVHDANGCLSSATATVTQPAQLTVNITGPSLLCSGTAGTLTANVGGGTEPYAYAWSGAGIASATSTATVNPTANETYTVVITDANGCTATASFSIVLPPPFTVSLPSATVCPGMSTTLCATVTGGSGGYLYTWTSSTGGTYPSTPCITVSPTTSTTYTVNVVDNCGATGNATTTVQLNPYPIVNFSADLYQGCVPLCVQFYNATTVPGGTAESYAWLFGNGDSSHIENPIYCYPKSGIYSVSLTVTSDSGCSATLKKSQMITVYPNPTAAFTMSPQPTTILNPTIQFTNTSTSTYPIIYWFWNFGDGSSDSLSNVTPNPTHTYGDTGNYCPQLVIMDIHGCTDTTTNCLIIEPIFTLYIPSAFTPNGGGLNETFTAKGVYVKTFSMDIFDRWGEHLYHTDDINAGWNGTVNGGSTVSQEDVYVYKITATDMENNPHNYIGSVTLIK